MTVVTPAQVAYQVKVDGGSDQQAWVAAALVSGIESNGDSQDKNPTSTACGLFQFLDTTWAADGGSKYGQTACDATWQEQVQVFLNASQGNNFYPWAPDLGGSYNGQPIYGPKSGSPVANKISELSATGKLAFLGNVPVSWIGATGGAGGVIPTSGLGSLIPGGGSVSTNNCTPVIKAATVTVLNSCQAQELLGGALLVGGGILAAVGLIVLLADVGLPVIIGGVAAKALGGKAGRSASSSSSSSSRPVSRSRQRNVESEAAANAGQGRTAKVTTVGRGSSNVRTETVSERKARRQREGFAGEGAAVA